MKAYKEDEGETPLMYIFDTDKIRLPNSLSNYIRMVLSSSLNRTAVYIKLILVSNVPYRQHRKMLQAGKTRFLPDPYLLASGNLFPILLDAINFVYEVSFSGLKRVGRPFSFSCCRILWPIFGSLPFRSSCFNLLVSLPPPCSSLSGENRRNSAK